MAEQADEMYPLTLSPLESLYELSMKCVVNNLGIITTYDPSAKRDKLNDVVLPHEVWEDFLEIYQKEHTLDNNLAALFKGHTKTRLKKVIINNSRITDRGMKCLLEHKPVILSLEYCPSLTPRTLDILNDNSENLVYLKLGAQISVFPEDLIFIFNTPKLRYLSIQRRSQPLYPMNLLPHVRGLTYLDLSECTGITTPFPKYALTHLISLIIYNVPWSKNAIDWIISMDTLKQLDISQAPEKHIKYLSPNRVLKQIVTSLPALEYLDISGTNLAGSGAAVIPNKDENEESMNPAGCDIPGLVTRVSNPLKFLGLYGTHHGACKRHDIPAKVITGDGDEKQILVSAQAYMKRPAMMSRILSDLYYLFRYEHSTDIASALYVVLDAMERYVSEKHIQISGSATLFYIVKGKGKANLGVSLKQRIIKAILVGLETHILDDTMMRNGCLTLCQFKIPGDVIFEYERVVTILLNGLTNWVQEGFVQRIAIYLLNSLACQVDGKQKRFLGRNGAIRKMLDMISDRLRRNLCDDVLEVAWSTMWNVTDETPENCQRFLDSYGMEHFLACLRRFADKEELLRNMMGLLGNVAEVAALRPKLMNKLFVGVFYELLNSSSDGIEVSYNAAGVLAHMASDGVEKWTVDNPPRDMVLARVAEAVDRWDMYAERNINYRSFEPILGLLRAYHTPQCQHWAVWALANLTTVYPAKYCNLVVAEQGMQLLHDIVDHPAPYKCIKTLARIVIDNCVRNANVDQPNSPRPPSPDN